MAGVLDEKGGYVFIHVPKCAGTSVMAALTQRTSARRFGELAGLQQIVEAENEHASEVVYRAGHARARDIRTYLGEETYEGLLSFAVVREPWDRLSSLYHFFRGHQGTPERDVAQRSFADFVTWYCEHRRNTMYERLTDRAGTIIVDRVLRYESLSEEFARLSDELGFDVAALPHHNASSNTGSPVALPESIVTLVQQTYRDDFRAFGYSPDPPG